MKRHAVPVFFALAFAISWVAWLPALAASLGYLAAPVPVSLTALLGAFGPTLAAVVLTVLSSGRRGLRRMLGRLLSWRVNVGWYVFALLWPAALSLLITIAHVGLGPSAGSCWGSSPTA